MTKIEKKEQGRKLLDEIQQEIKENFQGSKNELRNIIYATEYHVNQSGVLKDSKSDEDRWHYYRLSRGIKLSDNIEQLLSELGFSTKCDLGTLAEEISKEGHYDAASVLAAQGVEFENAIRYEEKKTIQNQKLIDAYRKLTEMSSLKNKSDNNTFAIIFGILAISLIGTISYTIYNTVEQNKPHSKRLQIEFSIDSSYGSRNSLKNDSVSYSKQLREFREYELKHKYK